MNGFQGGCFYSLSRSSLASSMAVSIGLRSRSISSVNSCSLCRNCRYFRREDLPAFAQDEVFRHGIGCVGAEGSGRWWNCPLHFETVFKEPYVFIYLANIGMGQLTDFQVDQQEAIEDEVVKPREWKSHSSIRIGRWRATNENPFRIPTKRLQVVDNGLFEIAFVKIGRIGKAEEFQHKRCFEDCLSGNGFTRQALASDGSQPGLATVGDDSLVVRRLNLQSSHQQD